MSGHTEDSLLVVIPAHNEASVIGSTVRALIDSISAHDHLVVVADNCSDDTVDRAREAGAQVVVRNSGSANGKGEALRWYMDLYRADLQDHSMVLILDADSQTKPDFIEKIKACICEDSQALQCFVYPLFESQSPIGKLAALSELIDQRIADKIRTTLHWPVRLRGTGMLIRPAILIEVGPQLDTNVEDIALSLLLTARGKNIRHIQDAMVFDPKPGSTLAASIQRARWFRGQWQAAWRYRKEIARVLILGPAGWSLLGSLFLRPKWLMLAGSAFGALIFSHWTWLAAFFGIYFLLGSLYLILGLILIPERRSFIKALLHVPAFIFMWLKSILLSLRSSFWHRARE